MILASHALGCNSVDAAVAYFLLLVVRTKAFARKVADPRSSAVSLVSNRPSRQTLTMFRLYLLARGLQTLLYR